jgi:hypothetical protein
MNLMFIMNLLNLIHFINITSTKNNLNLLTLIKCYNGKFISNVDMNMILILLKGVHIYLKLNFD